MIEEDNKTLWCGNLAEQVTEELLYELFLQAGPLKKVRIPRDRDGRQKNFAFVTYCHEVSVPYALSLFRGTSLFHKTLSLQTRGKTALLPPPIRCYGPDTSGDLTSQANVIKQFADMTEKIKEDISQPVHIPMQRQNKNDMLVKASLQGNWSHRHHPYRSKESKPHREEYRHKDHDKYKIRSSHSVRRDRWNHRNQRRD